MGKVLYDTFIGMTGATVRMTAPGTVERSTGPMPYIIGASLGTGSPLSYEYSAQNHDWDLTLHAAAELIKAGLAMDARPQTGNLSLGLAGIPKAPLNIHICEDSQWSMYDEFKHNVLE